MWPLCAGASRFALNSRCLDPVLSRVLGLDSVPLPSRFCVACITSRDARVSQLERM